MKNLLTILFAWLLLPGCVPPSRIITYTVPTQPVYHLDPAPQKVIFVNCYDVKAKHFRENKEAMFVSLIDNLLDSAAKRVHRKTGIATMPVFGYTDSLKNTDSAMRALLTKENASHVIVIDAFDVYFNQTHVEVTKDPSTKSKTREAFYDIVSGIHYKLYNRDSLVKPMEMLLSRYHSSRNVISGLLAAGPNLVTNEEDALRISLDNLQQYLNYYFAGQKVKTRTLLCSEKGFEAMIAAVDVRDYEAAFKEAKLLLNNPNNIIVAQAGYDCAVFCEMKGLVPEALDYLRAALKKYALQPAFDMLKELEP